MAMWDILGIPPTANEDELRQAYACAVCRALDVKDKEKLGMLRDAWTSAHQSVQHLSPVDDSVQDNTPNPDRLRTRGWLFQRSQDLLGVQAEESAWLQFTSSPAFLSLQDDPHLLGWLVWLCSSPYPAMASALYTAYGFSSSKAMTVHPASGQLRDILKEYCQLPVDDGPHLSQQDIQRLTLSTLNGIRALQNEPQSIHLWQQVFQLSDFLLLRYQPHFLLALGRFVNTHSLSGECLLTLAEALSGQIRNSPCFAELAAILPDYASPQVWSSPDLFAGFLLHGNAKEFLESVRNKLFFLLEQTAENFKNSSQRHPWDYVFARPQFSLVKRDLIFLDRLMVFAQNKALPLPFWQSLHDAYLEDFLRMKDPEVCPQLFNLRNLIHGQLVEKSRQPEKTSRHVLCSPSFLYGVASLYFMASLWLCLQEPMIGVPMLLAPLLLLFLG